MGACGRFGPPARLPHWRYGLLTHPCNGLDRSQPFPRLRREFLAVASLLHRWPVDRHVCSRVAIALQNYVYDCSDMTECVPDFEFAPQRTFTVADAVRVANKGYVSHFGGKWHLGSFYNDSEALGGITSSPVTHGFDLFNATVEVSPTATTNCECNAAWQPSCDYGHYGSMTHCSGGQGPDPNASKGCCFNYCELCA
jgi:hypothetical protein